MDGMFNLGMYGLVSPQERNDDLKKKRGFFWANKDANQKRSSLENFDIMNMGEGTGVLDEKNKLSQITSTQSANWNKI